MNILFIVYQFSLESTKLKIKFSISIIIRKKSQKNQCLPSPLLSGLFLSESYLSQMLYFHNNRQNHRIPFRLFVDKKIESVTMGEIAKEAGDKLFVHILSYYQKNNSKLMSRFIARTLHRKKHIKIVRILTKKLQKAASIYPVRSFGIENDIQIQKCLEKAKQKKQELKEKGIKADIIREEPFVEAQDSVQYKIYLMKWKQQRGNYTAEIEEITI